MNEIIEEIKRKIAIESSSLHMTPEQEQYVVGLADALQIIEEHCANQLVIGKKYYVLTYSKYERCVNVEEMTLYRINNKKKRSYCFTKNNNNPVPDLVLYSKSGLKMRVFNTIEEAQNGKSLFLSSLQDGNWRRRRL